MFHIRISLTWGFPFVFFTKGNTEGDVVNGGQTGAVSLDEFTSNSELYPSIGPDNAQVTVVEFSDFQCPYCALASGLPAFAAQYSSQYADLIGSASKVEKLAEEGKIKFVYVPMSFLGPESGYTAEASLCANEQDKFFEMHRVIFSNHDGEENNGKYNKDKLKVLASRIQGLDTTKFNTCLDSSKYASTVEDINSAANSAGVSGTPTFFVNGEKLSASWSQLSAKIRAAGVDTSSVS